ncbi:MAG: sigma-70 family RNA polymerase sigma factor [Krumholzibacteria bacterium]|nr:sigma-70 family RNA polymerase sigma factor [Candidatus Krumholzibacteria bacterium]
MDLTRACKAEGSYIDKSIAITAVNLVRNLRLPPDDIEDIKQDLWMDLLLRLPAYDPERSSLRTFITRLVRNKRENLRESYRAMKRDVWKAGPSLDEEIELEDGVAGRRGDLLNSDDYDQNVRGRNLTALARLELSIDIRAVLRGLDEEQLIICQLIEDAPSLVAVARALGMSRPTLYQRLAVLRGRFRELKN